MNHEINDCRPTAEIVSNHAKCNSRAKMVYKGFFHKAYCQSKHSTEGDAIKKVVGDFRCILGIPKHV